jgi:hypothetical protein
LQRSGICSACRCGERAQLVLDLDVAHGLLGRQGGEHLLSVRSRSRCSSASAATTSLRDALGGRVV